MGSLHLYLPFSMEYRARAPSIRSRLLPTLRTFHLLVPPISMLQQHLPQHLSHQLPPLLRQLARNLIKTRFGMLFPPIPHRLKHLLRTTHKLRLRLFSFHLIPLFLFSTFLLPPVYLPSASQKIWDAPDNFRRLTDPRDLCKIDSEIRYTKFPARSQPTENQGRLSIHAPSVPNRAICVPQENPSPW